MDKDFIINILTKAVVPIVLAIIALFAISNRNKNKIKNKNSNNISNSSNIINQNNNYGNKNEN